MKFEHMGSAAKGDLALKEREFQIYGYRDRNKITFNPATAFLRAPANYREL